MDAFFALNATPFRRLLCCENLASCTISIDVSLVTFAQEL
jgi:hypothetical protein